MSLHLHDGPRASTGAMTSVMRAALPQTEAKVLRIALVSEGRVIEERILREHGDVTIGSSERATFVVGETAFGPSFRLFERANQQYWLRTKPAMRGRVALASGLVDLEHFGGDRIRLEADARGKIQLGPVSLLFQLVVPPPKAMRAQLPLAVRGGFSKDVDWVITILAALSFLAHFGFVGSMYSDWLDPVVSGDSTVGILEMTSNLPTPSPAVEDRPSETNETKTTTTTKEPSARARARATERASSEQRVASMVNEAQTMKLELLGAFAGTSAVAGALRRSEVPVTSLEEQARSDRGAEAANGELKLAHDNGTSPPATNLRDLGRVHTDGLHAGQEHGVDGPHVFVTNEPIPPPPGLPGAERTLVQLRPSWRSCYVNKGLSHDPGMEGKLVIAIQIAPNGDVTDVKKVDGSGLSSEVEQCIATRTRAASFDAPGGLGTTLRVPIVFRQQH